MYNNKLHTCPRCNGKKTLTVTVYDTTISEVDLPCVYCNGKGEVSDHELKQIEFEDKMWCECEKSHEWTFVPDGQGIIRKHHYTCDHCGKITQIG